MFDGLKIRNLSFCSTSGRKILPNEEDMEPVTAAVYLLHKSGPGNTNKRLTPCEKWTRRNSDLHHGKAYECVVYPHISAAR